MAKPINLKTLTDEERGVLVEAIPVLRNMGEERWWENTEFKRLYKKWLETTKSSHVDGGFEQFKLGIYQMRKAAPLDYKINKVMTDATTKDIDLHTEELNEAIERRDTLKSSMIASEQRSQIYRRK